MTIPPRARRGLIVLLVALIGLAVDRLLLPAPRPVSAAPGEITAQAPAEVGDPPVAAVPAPTEPLPTEVPDVFSWERLGRQTRIAAPRAAQPPVDPAVEFGRRHVLQAVIAGPRPLARVSDRTLGIGDELDGFRLSAVQNQEAVFVSDGQRVVLRLARPAP